MSRGLILGLAASILALGVTGDAQADGKSLWEMNVAERRAYFRSEPERVKACPTDDDEFWSHWATEQGYEQLFHGHLDEAARCYAKAGQMYRRGVAEEYRNNCFVCDGYERAGTILRNLPEGAVNIRRETFEESARRALSAGNRELAAKLYELTALGYSLELEGYYGRFGTSAGGLMVHRERTSWADEYRNASNSFERAAELVSNPTERRKLLQQARVVNAILLDTGRCSSWGHEQRVKTVAGYPECRRAKANVDRLDIVLR